MPTTDIFGRLPLEFGGAFSADAAAVTFGLGPGVESGVGLLTQNLQFTYQQAITRLYELGTRKTFYIAGRSQGNGQIGRVLGPRAATLAFYAAYGNVCNAMNNILNFAAGVGCNSPGDITGPQALVFTLTGVIILSIAMSVQSENMIVGEQLGIMFVAMLAS